MNNQYVQFFRIKPYGAAESWLIDLLISLNQQPQEDQIEGHVNGSFFGCTMLMSERIGQLIVQ